MGAPNAAALPRYMEMCQSGLLYFPAKEVVAAKGPVGSNPAISAKHRDLVEKNELS